MIRKFKTLILSVLIILSISVTFAAILMEITPLKIVKLTGVSMTGIERENWFHMCWVSDDLNLKRNDIIIFDSIEAIGLKKLSEYKDIDSFDEETYTKRIIALEGETVEIESGKLLINNNLIKDKFSINGFTGKNMNQIKNPKDYYFVVGDYRVNSLDSRYLEPILKSSIIGKVILYDNIIFKKFLTLLAIDLVIFFIKII
jgi:signal peptidase I